MMKISIYAWNRTVNDMYKSHWNRWIFIETLATLLASPGIRLLWLLSIPSCSCHRWWWINAQICKRFSSVSCFFLDNFSRPYTFYWFKVIFSRYCEGRSEGRRWVHWTYFDLFVPSVPYIFFNILCMPTSVSCSRYLIISKISDPNSSH